MANTSEGAKKGAETTRQRHGDEFFENRARLGGKASSGGFTKGSDAARQAGLKGAAKRWKKSNGGAIS